MRLQSETSVFKFLPAAWMGSKASTHDNGLVFVQSMYLCSEAFSNRDIILRVCLKLKKSIRSFQILSLGRQLPLGLPSADSSLNFLLLGPFVICEFALANYKFVTKTTKNIPVNYRRELEVADTIGLCSITELKPVYFIYITSHVNSNVLFNK